MILFLIITILIGAFIISGHEWQKQNAIVSEAAILLSGDTCTCEQCKYFFIEGIEKFVLYGVCVKQNNKPTVSAESSCDKFRFKEKRI